MVRTQIQLPDPLYQEVKRIARDQDWSIAEVMRRGAEAVARAYPPEKGINASGWELPPPLQSELLTTDPDALKNAIRDDQAARSA